MHKSVHEALREDGYTLRAKEAYKKMFKDGDTNYYKIASNLYNYMHETFPTQLNPTMLSKLLDEIKKQDSRSPRRKEIIQCIIQFVLETNKSFFYKGEKIEIYCGELFTLNYDGMVRTYFKNELFKLCMFTIDNQYAFEKFKDKLIMGPVGSLVLLKNSKYLHKILDIKFNQILTTNPGYETQLHHYYEIEEIFPIDVYEELHTYYNNQKKQFNLLESKISSLKKRKQSVLEKLIFSETKIPNIDFSHFTDNKDSALENLDSLLKISSEYELVELIKFCRKQSNDTNKEYFSKISKSADEELRRKLYV